MGNSLVNIDVGSIASSIMDGLDKLFTSDEERLKYANMIEQRLHERLTAQTDINLKEAENPSVFVSGWRPALGWTCVGGIAYQFILQPMLIWINTSISFVLGTEVPPQPPMLDIEQLLSLVVAMLGIAGYRSYEKVKNVARIK